MRKSLGIAFRVWGEGGGARYTQRASALRVDAAAEARYLLSRSHNSLPLATTKNQSSFDRRILPDRWLTCKHMNTCCYQAQEVISYIWYTSNNTYVAHRLLVG
ncbi:unnamed protein product [Laminaria digitata]